MSLIYRNFMQMSYSTHRYIHTTFANNKIFGPIREGKFMKKIVQSEVPRKKWYPERNEKVAPSLPSSTSNLVSPHVTRRVKVLNKLFMKYITDIMSTGEVSADVTGLGIEISQVKISNDFKFVRVLWFSYNTGNLDQITDILKQISYKLRHELSQLKIIGVVPPIIFVRDKQLSSMVQLEKMFEIADYGEDYVRTLRTAPTPELSLFTKLPEEVRDKILESDSSGMDVNESYADDEVCNEELYQINLPPMRCDVLGLNQGIIMSQIKQSLHKSKEAIKNRLHNLSNDIPEKIIKLNPPTIDTLRTEEEIQAFDDFLLKRRIEEKHRKKRETLEYLDESNFDFQGNTEDDKFDDDEDFNFDRFDDIRKKELH